MVTFETNPKPEKSIAALQLEENTLTHKLRLVRLEIERQRKQIP